MDSSDTGFLAALEAALAGVSFAARDIWGAVQAAQQGGVVLMASVRALLRSASIGVEVKLMFETSGAMPAFFVIVTVKEDISGRVLDVNLYLESDAAEEPFWSYSGERFGCPVAIIAVPDPVFLYDSKLRIAVS